MVYLDVNGMTKNYDGFKLIKIYENNLDLKNIDIINREYNNFAYELLGLLIFEKSQLNIQTFMKKYIFDKLDMKDTIIYDYDKIISKKVR